MLLQGNFNLYFSSEARHFNCLKVICIFFYFSVNCLIIYFVQSFYWFIDHFLIDLSVSFTFSTMKMHFLGNKKIQHKVIFN